MEHELGEPPSRAISSISYWQAECKDCAAERRMKAGATQQAHGGAVPAFEYSAAWADREFEIGHTRSDRCERHRRLHREAIRALAVPYVDLEVIGEVRDRNNPTGPLGGLGPLPPEHRRRESRSSLEHFGFGMADEDVLKILEGLREKRVAVIEAGTGSGKSTFLPYRLMNPPEGASFLPTDSGPIVVTEPRRAAATGVSVFVGEALCFGHDSRTCTKHVGPGFPVGYQVSGDRNWDGACDLVYVTDGTMINWVRDGSLARIGTVIVDEAHERSENIDIILAQLREKINEYKHLRVIITSATIDRSFFISYFGGEDKVFHCEIPEQKRYGYGVPLFVDLDVSDSIIENGLTIGADSISFSGWAERGPSEEPYPPDYLQLETEKYEKLRCIEEIPVEQWKDEMPSALARQILRIAEGTEWGDILGFLPTTRAIDSAVRQIEDGLAARSLSFDVYPLLSSVEKTTVDRAIQARKRGEKRKVVISSNLAETSLTVSGVRFVVDSGLICQSEWDPRLASGSLPTKPHSRAGLRQRWGRVGRDAPGWVFPLYTIEQFLSLAKDTPPESTRKNLEAFCTKLIAAGIDPSNDVLPSNYVDDAIRLDEHAADAMNGFRAELARAQHCLAKSGLIDKDGHLTEFGREIERYPGEAATALAVALGDQLACLHEVALAVTMLGDGLLYGNRNDCVLRVDFEWPSAWRVRAFSCHSALALGSQDDLDLAIAIANSYIRAQDKETWCRTWWVNRPALDAALRAVYDIVDHLSGGMKQAARRDFAPRLVPKARAVLARAFPGIHYRRVHDDQFEQVPAEDDERSTLQDFGLLTPSEDILAFRRYSRTDADNAKTTHISHVVNYVGWAALADIGSDEVGFGLLLEAARQSGGEASPQDSGALWMLREQLPVGAVAGFTFGRLTKGVRPVSGLSLVCESFLPPLKTGGRIGKTEADETGFDREWEPNPRGDEATPDESELAERIEDPRQLETNDTFVEDSGRASDSDQQLPTFFAEDSTSEAGPVDGRCYIVSGYRFEGERPILRLEPFDPDTQDIDPAEHKGIHLFDEVELEYVDEVRDAYWSFLRFRRAGSFEHFIVPRARACSLSRYDHNLELAFSPGATCVGVVIRTEVDKFSVSLKSYLKADLQNGNSEKIRFNEEVIEHYPARIINLPNEYGNVVVELDHVHEFCGVRNRFQVPASWLGDSKKIPIALEQELLVGFRDDVDTKNFVVADANEIENFVARNSRILSLDGNKLYPTAPIAPGVAANLSHLAGSGASWNAKVSRLFERSQNLWVVSAKAKRREEIPSLTDLSRSLLTCSRFDFEKRFDVRVVSDPSGHIVLRSLDAEVLQAACDALEGFENLSRVSARLPVGTARLLLQHEPSKRQELQEGPGIHWVWVDGDIVHIVGESKTVVRKTASHVANLVGRVTATVSVPQHQIGAFFGTGGSHLKAAIEVTGCRADKLDSGKTWKVTGPSPDTITTFVRVIQSQAQGRADGVSYVISSSEQLTILEERSKRASKRPAKSGGGAKQTTKSDPPNQQTGRQTKIAIDASQKEKLLSKKQSLLSRIFGRAPDKSVLDTICDECACSCELIDDQYLLIRAATEEARSEAVKKIRDVIT